MRTKRFWAVVLLLMMAVSLVPKVTFAAAGDPPAHDKTLTVNNDGTYTIALSVTGDSEKEPNKANVIVVFDTSSSMNTATGNTEITYTPTDSTGGWYYQDDLYGLINEEYVPLERQTSGNWPNITYTFWYDGTEYTGQRYSRQSANQSRLQAAEEAVNALAKALLAYNGGDNPADTIQIALVDFANMAEIAQGPTTDYATFEAAVNSRNAGNNNRGTNWEAGLRTALNVNFNDPAGAKDKTYVIFVSDGNPTFYVNNNNTQGGTGQETNDNIATSYNQAVPAAEALVDAGYEFYTIGVYGNVTRMENLTTASGAPANHYYAAADTAALQAALASILNEIEMAGIGSVSMSDGTTSSVTTESGEIANLLTVDQSSYKYYRSGGSYSTTANGGLGDEWSGAPAATFENGAVKWDLSSEGVLEDDVTYTVTFDCWPSQTTLDIIADIKNDPSEYDKLDPEIQKYITRNGDLRTNTSASLTYVDTRTGQSGSATYENPDPVETTAAKQLAVSKKWENELDGQEAKPITLKVTCDDEDKYTVDLSNDNNWTDNVYISIGILRTTGGTVEVLSPGHEFTFVEPKDLGYYWELDVPVVRPMLVNGTLTMLIKTDAKHQPNGAQTYEIDGKEYFVSDTGTAGLTAVNHRRSRLNITKDVVGEAADPEQKFEFKINVVDSKASEGSADDLNSDYWVWFSVWDGDFVDCVISGAEKQMKEGSWTGYYYAPSGSDIVVELKKGDNLRFLNLPSDSTYTITEQNIPNYYAFTRSELTSGTDSTFSGGETTTGKIETVNEDYTVKITNTYELTNVEIEKTFSGITEDQIPDDFTITASFKVPEGYDSIADKELKVSDEDVKQSGLTFTWTIEDLPVGTEVTATESGTVVEDYELGEVTNSGPVTTSTTETVKLSIGNPYEYTMGTLKITKKLGDDSDKVEIPEGTTFTISGPEGYDGPTSITYADFKNGVYEATVLAGEYTVTEDTESAKVEGYALDTESDPSDGKVTVEVNGTGEVTITNTYTREKGKLKITKKLGNESDEVEIPGDTTFSIEGPEDYDGPASITYADFENDSYEIEVPTGDYTVTEDEESAEVENYTLESESDPSDGKVTVEADGTAEVTVTNTYHRQKGILKITKKLGDDSDKVDIPEGTTFSITGPEDYDGPESITYDDFEDGTYEIAVPTGDYTVTEDEASAEVEYYNLESESDPSDGKVTVEDDKTAEVTITNTYIRKTGKIKITKKLGDDSDKVEIPGGTTFNIVGGPEGHAGVCWYDDFENGSYEIEVPTGEYTVTEYTATAEIENYNLEVESDPEDGKVMVEEDDTAEVTITNTYTRKTGKLVIIKKLGDESDDVEIPEGTTFTIEGPEDYEGPESITYADFEDGKYELEVPTGDYTVKEDTDSAEVEHYALEAESDPEDGKVTVEEDETAEITITNSYTRDKGTLKITKKLGDDSDEVEIPEGTTFTIEGPEDYDGPTTITYADFEDGEYKAVVPAGEYTVTEDTSTAEVEGYTLESESDPSDGKVTVELGETAEVTVTNTYTKIPPDTITITVKKVWDDNNDKDGIRPDSVTVVLKANGEETGDELVLSADNDWTGEFADVDKTDSEGEEIEYTVEEKEVPEGYTATVDGDSESGFTVTNTHTEVPKTGDNSNLLFWIILLAVSAIAAGAIVVTMIRKRSKER